MCTGPFWRRAYNVRAFPAGFAASPRFLPEDSPISEREVPSVLRDSALFVAQIALPAIALAIAAWRDRYDGKPDYVVPWVVFACILWAAWAVPVGSRSRVYRSHIDIPRWVWAWIALVGVLVFRR